MKDLAKVRSCQLYVTNLYATTFFVTQHIIFGIHKLVLR